MFGEYACMKCKLYENNPKKIDDIFHCVNFRLFRMIARCAEEVKRRISFIAIDADIADLYLKRITMYAQIMLDSRNVRFVYKC